MGRHWAFEFNGELASSTPCWNMDCVCVCLCVGGGGVCVCVLQACLCCACMRVKQGLGSHVAWWCRMSQGCPTGA